MSKQIRTGKSHFLIVTSILYVLVFLFYYNSIDIRTPYPGAKMEHPISIITGNAMSDGSTVERRLSSTVVQPGDIVTVYIDVTISQGPQTHTYDAIEEYVPASWTIINHGTGYQTGNTIKWLYVNDTVQAPSVTYNYTVRAPSAGSYAFDGIFWIEGMSNNATIEGDSLITVSGCIYSGPEYCDNQDNDCDSGTVDGSDETWYSQPCDGPDADLCTEGVWQCISGNKVCSDSTPDTLEICNDGNDNDCDGQTDIQDTDCWQCTTNNDCDNGFYCDGDEYCSNHQCQTTPRNKDDNVACTIDSCDEETNTVIHTPTDSLCDNNLWCDGQEICDPVNGCISGTAPNCSDQYLCTDDSCNEASDICEQTKNNNNCDVGETCEPVYFAAPTGCGMISTCTGAQDGTLCDDGLFCNGIDQCQSQQCVNIGPVVDCDDNVGCTDDICSETAKDCIHTANNTYCDNNQWCDGKEYCDVIAGCMNGTAPTIDDGITCTLDSCDEVNDAVVNTPTDSLCDNNLWCDGQEICDPVNGCISGTAPDCTDQYLCTDDSCNENANRCDNIANDANCASGESCAPVYFPTGSGCGIIAECTGQSNGTLCDDGVYCNGIDECQSQLCVNIGPIVDCNDAESCTRDSCNESAQRCDSIPIDDDNDGYDICTGSNQDCDDTNARVNPGEDEQCTNGRDDDCDSLADIDDSSCSFCSAGDQQLCSKQQGVCSGSKETCSQSGEWPGCDKSVYSSWNSKYEVQENSCDNLDNDCDGTTDEGCSSSGSTSSSTSSSTGLTRTRTPNNDTTSSASTGSRTRKTAAASNQSTPARTSREIKREEAPAENEEPKTVDEVLDENAKTSNTLFYVLLAVMAFIGIVIVFYFKKKKITFNQPAKPPQYGMLQQQPQQNQSLTAEQQRIRNLQDQFNKIR